MTHVRNETKLSRQAELARKIRKDKVRQWVYYADREIDKGTAKACMVTPRACHAILMAINKTSFTGDFTNATQQRIAKVAGYSKRTVVKAVKALKIMGLIYVKHQYAGKGKERRRTASFTVLKAFRKKYHKIKSWLSCGLSAKQIEQKIIANSVSAQSASQISFYNKAVSNFGILDKRTGEVSPIISGMRHINDELMLRMGGV